MLHRFELAHSTFSFPGRLMRVLRPIIESPATAVLDLWNQFTMCARVARKFIGDDLSRTVAQPLEQFLEEPLGRPGIASTLYQDIQHFAFLVYGSPRVDKLPVDLAKDFVEMPGVSTPTPLVTKAPSVLAAELQAPKPNRFMGDHHTALEHHFLDIAKAQAEAEIQPDAMGDNLSREAVSPVAWCSGGIHRTITSCP